MICSILNYSKDNLLAVIAIILSILGFAFTIIRTRQSDRENYYKLLSEVIINIFNLKLQIEKFNERSTILSNKIYKVKTIRTVGSQFDDIEETANATSENTS
jgi:hypothetical protein